MKKNIGSTRGRFINRAEKDMESITRISGVGYYIYRISGTSFITGVT